MLLHHNSIASEANASANLPVPGKVVPPLGGMRPLKATKRVQAWEVVNLLGKPKENVYAPSLEIHATQAG